MSKIKGKNLYHCVKIKNGGELSFEILVKGVLMKYENHIHLNVPHLGLNVKTVEFNNKQYKKFKYSEWSGNIIVNINKEDINDDQFIFTQDKLKKKHVDPMTSLMINGEKCKYIKQEYFPINMMFNNPSMLFYKLKYFGEPPNIGEPLYYNRNLYGICDKVDEDNNIVYVVPMIFIIKSIINNKNNLLFCTNKKINQINKFKVREGKFIFCPQIQYTIKLETYLLYLSNDKRNIIINDDINTFLKFDKNKNIKKNTNIFHWARLFNNDLCKCIIENYNLRSDRISFDVDGIEHSFIY